MNKKNKEYILVFVILLVMGFILGIWSTHSYFCEVEKIISCESIW